MTDVYLDIETVPAQDPAVLDTIRENVSQNFKAPSTMTKEQAAIDLGITDKDTIKFTSKDSMLAMWAEKFKDEATEAAAQAEWRKTSFDGAVGHVCVIGLAFDDEPPLGLYMDTWQTNEANLLRMFFSIIDQRLAENPNVRPTFIGHNIINFDLRFLYQRSVMLGVKPSRHIPFSARPWDDAVFDTMTRWAGTNGQVKLDKLVKAMGLQGKGSEIGEEIDGSMVWDFVKAGRIADVATYCCGDVERVRGVHKRMTFACEETKQLEDVQV